MTISEATWNAYIAKLRQVSTTAAEKFKIYLWAHKAVDKESTDALIEYAYALATKYGEAAGALAAEMYDAIAEASGVLLEPALLAETATMHETARAVVGTMKTGNDDIVADAVGRLVKMAGVDTTMRNAIRDHAEWAWIPRGDTCAFCIALASQGWMEASESQMKGNHAQHIHANCDCTFAIRHSPDDDVEGYDPDVYREMYYYTTDENGNRVSRGNSARARLNGMRRDFYARNKERIDRQPISDEAKRIALNSSAADEIDVG